MRDLPAPLHLFKAGFAVARRAPSIWIARIGFEVAAYAARVGAVFTVGLWFVAHLGIHLADGGVPSTWPKALLATLSDPAVPIALGGAIVAAWAVLLACESLVYAAMWGGLNESLRRPGSIGLGVVGAAAFETFGRAVGIRWLVHVAEATLVAVTIGSMFIIGAIADAFGAGSSDPLVAKALTWALCLTVLTTSLAAVRLCIELVAAAAYVEDSSLGEALSAAAHTVVEHPIYVYRLFVISAVVLVPPLAIGWLAAILQNVFLMTPGLETVAGLLRMTAEAALLLGLALFSVALQSTFFVYYAWRTGRFQDDELGRPRHLVRLQDLLPPHYAVVVDVDDALAQWPEDHPEVTRGIGGPARAARPSTTRRNNYDFRMILRDSATSDEEE